MNIIRKNQIKNLLKRLSEKRDFLTFYFKLEETKHIQKTIGHRKGWLKS